MIGATRHLSDPEQLLRWTVVVAGFATVAVTIWFCFRDKAHHPRAKIIPIFVSLVAVGISLNYILKVPVVFPGALCYLVAYTYVIFTIGDEMDAGHKGRPGEPGQPGEPGTPTHGGAGGAGGTGGIGGRASRVSGHLLGFLVLAAVILAVVSGVALWTAQRVQTNTNRLDRLVATARTHAIRDEQAIRLVTYRICSRQMEVRAAIILHVDRTRTHNNALLDVLPIFDCRPDLVGKLAQKLTLAQTRAFLRHFDHHQALAP